MRIQILLTALTAVLSLWPVASAALAQTEIASSVRVEVTPEGIATVSGRSESTVNVVRELCEQAGVKLEWRAPADEPFAGNLEQRPLYEVFERLLDGKSYIIGANPESKAKKHGITWLRVLDSGSGNTVRSATHRRVAAASANERYAGKKLVRSGTIEEGFDSDDPAIRRKAVLAIKRDIFRNPENRRVFMETPTALISDEILFSKHPERIARELYRTETDMKLKMKLSQLMTILNAALPSVR